jgi:hypothetical protein
MGHQHRIDNALAQQRQGKYGTTLDLLGSTDKTLTLTTLPLQLSCAEGRVERLHCQGTWESAMIRLCTCVATCWIVLSGVRSAVPVHVESNIWVHSH